MPPHAEVPDSPRGSIDRHDDNVLNGYTNGHSHGYTNGHTNGHSNGHINGQSNGHSNGHTKGLGGGHPANLSSRLEPVPKDEMHDMICVGFGPASLAIAVALHDAIDSGDKSVKTDRPKVAFLERQEQFAWHAGMQIPGAKMQISFVKDLATLRNPRSEFTFLNYLFSVGRLVQFTNLSTFLPRRLEYEDYMRWCSKHFDDVVSYGEEVLSVDPIKSLKSGKKTAGFSITSRNHLTGELSTRKAKNVVIAAGGRAKIPAPLPENHPRVVHSSRYMTESAKIFPDTNAALRIAVVGGGQSAAEIFNDVHQRFPNSTATLLIKDTALRPSDDSPFVNEIFDPDRVDKIYTVPADRRAQMIQADKPTNYGVVRLELLEHIYEELYMQRLEHGNDESKWPKRIMPQRRVTSVSGTNSDSGPITLHLENTSTAPSTTEQLDFDLVYVAAGYDRNAYEYMLRDCRHLMPGGDAGQKWSVARDYSVEFEAGKLEAGAGVWLQGCNEMTHGLSDTLLSILSVRGGEMVQNIFGSHEAVGNGVNGH